MGVSLTFLPGLGLNCNPSISTSAYLGLQLCTTMLGSQFTLVYNNQTKIRSDSCVPMEHKEENAFNGTENVELF
jgi:hypothetical protein